jgi:hypothetical protein
MNHRFNIGDRLKPVGQLNAATFVIVGITNGHYQVKWDYSTTIDQYSHGAVDHNCELVLPLPNGLQRVLNDL